MRLTHAEHLYESMRIEYVLNAVRSPQFEKARVPINI